MKKSFSLRSWLTPRTAAMSLGMVALGMVPYDAQAQTVGSSTSNVADPAWATQGGWAHQMTFRAPTFGPATLTANITATATRNGSNQVESISWNTTTASNVVYHATPFVVISGGGGTGATAVAVLDGDGKISAINVTNGGSGYTTNPTVAISREIVAFNMLTPGSGYLPGSPRVTATGGTLISGGAQAVGYGVIDPVTGSFTGINIVNYGRYTGTAATGPTSATVPENAPEGAGAFIHFNTDITANRILSLGENRKLGQLILGDLSGSEIYTLTAGASGAIVNGQPETGSLTFDMGEFGGGHAFINKFQGGADVIDAPMTLMDQVNVRVTTSTLNLDSFLDGPGVLTSYGAGILALGGDNTGSTVPLWLWNRGGTGTGAQVLLEAAVGNAIGSDIRVGNVSYGNSGHAVLQLAQNRTNFDQINDRATIVFDGINGRWNYFKLLGGNETVGRLWDMNNSSVIENSEGEAAPTNAILTVGDNSLAGPDADSYIGAHMRDRSSGTLLSDQGGKLGLTKIGDGRLTLDGTVIANAIIYTGATTLQQGSLLLRNTTAFNSTITASAGTSLIFDRTTTGAWNFDELILDNNGDGGADVVKTGIGPLTLSRTSLTQAMTREFGSLSVQNGSLNLHGPAVIARDIVVAGQPGIAPDVRITGNVNVGGGIDFKGRFGFLGSTLTINALATTVRSAVPTTANPTPDNVTLLDEGVVNVAGGVRVTNADLILQGMVTQTRATGSSASSGNTVVMADVAGLAAGMTVFGAGLPAGGAKILEVNTTTRTLTLSVNATIAAETQLRFGSDGAGRITGASSITIANKPYQGLPTAASQSGSIQLINTLESNNNNRLPDNATLISKGGNFDFRNEQLNAGGLIFSEKLGMMDLQGGDLVVSAYRAALGGQSTLTFDSLNRAPGSTVQFLGKEYINGAATVNNAELGKDLRNRVLFSSAPVLSNDIIGGWALLGNDFATYDGSTGVKALPASSYALNTLFDGTAATPINSWVATSNGRINGPGATITPSGLPGGRMIINSLSLYSTGNAANYTVALGSNLMSIQSGGLVAAFGAHTINGAAPGGLTISLADGAARDLVTHIETGRTLTVNAPIVDFTATTPSNSTVTSQSQTVTVNTTVGLVAGMAVTGPGIPAGTTIAEVVSGTSITLSQPANASFTNAALTFTGGSVGLTKAGLGTMVLNGSNTYTGKTFINNGVLQINGDSRLGIAPNAPAADQITLNGGTLLSMATIPFNVNRGVTVGEAGGRIQVGNAAVNQFVVDIPAPINGIGTLELAVVANPTGIPATATTSVLNLGTEASTNVYAGGIKTDTTIVNASGTVTSSGTINILGNNVIGGLFLESAATVNLPGNNNFTKGIQILSGTLTLSGTNTFNGQAALSQPVIVTGGVLTLQSQNALGTGPLHLEMATSEVKLGGLDRTIGSIISTSNSRLTNTGAPITLTFDTQLSQTFLGNINGTGTGAITLVKKGPATLNLLNQTNIITGGVRIEEGVLNVRNISSAFLSGSIGSAVDFGPSHLVLDGGVLSFSPIGQVRTDRSFTLGAGANGGALVANGGTQTARVVLGLEFRQTNNNYITPPVGFVGNGPRTLTLGGPNVGDNEFNIELGDSATGRTALMKIGSGTWTLGKDASYTGLTTVQEGVLGIMQNNSLGTKATPTTATPGSNTFTGNVPNGVQISFTSFVNAYDELNGNPDSVPVGIQPNLAYYVVESNGTTFKVATTPGGTPVEFTSEGTNVQYVANVKSIASTTVDAGTDRFAGRLTNGTALTFNVRQFHAGNTTTLTNGSLPTGLSGVVTYYVVNAQDGSFQVSATPGGAPVDMTSAGIDFYYSLVTPVTNTSYGVNLLGGRMDLRNVDYLTPETIFFEGGALLIPANSASSWAGDFQVNVNSNITINANGKLIMNGNLMGNRTITQLGEGTMVLRGEALAIGTNVNGQPSTPDNFRRAYVLQAGTLVLDYSENNNSKLVDNATFQMGGSRRGGVLRLTGGSHEEIVNTLSLQAGNNKIYRDDGTSVIRLNNIARAVGSSLYFDLPRIAKVDNANSNGILGAWALIRDAAVEAYWLLPGTINSNVTVDPNTDTFSVSGGPNRFMNGTVVRLTSTGTLPAGVSANTDYYVIGTANDTGGGLTFRLATTYNGATLDVFNTGSGIHTASSFAPVLRPNTASLLFRANGGVFPGSVGNGKIKVAIDYVGGLGPITSTLTGAGTEANPYIYTIYTTDYIADLDDPETPQNETEVNTNRGNNPRNLANFVTGDFLVAQILTASTSAGSGANADELLPDTNDYAATFLSGGTEDSGSQELDWARNGSTVADAFNDGFVMAVASSSYSNNAWNVNLNTNISASGTRINSTTNSLRFANSGAASVNLAGGVNIVQTGGILVSPTVGANDSAITGVGQLVTENEGNLQNFLIHQYNTAGDLVITAPIAERAEFVRTGRLASNIANHSLRLLHSLATTTDLAPGMTVSGTGIAAGSIIEEILDGHTVKLDRNTTQTAGQRNIVIFTGGGGSVTLLASFGDTTGGSARRRIYGLVVPADPERNRQERVSSSDLYIGLPVVGPGIPAGATIASIPNDADIILNVDHFYTGIVSNMSFKPSVGVEKLGPGTLILGGQNTYTGVTFVGDGMLRAQSLTDGGVAGSLGISNNGAGNLVFNGGTLQYVGQNASTNRAFTLTEFAVLNIGHERTRVTFSGAVSGTDRLEKSGSGTLIMTGNAGLSELRVDEGTLRVQIVDANPAPATFSASNFGTSNLMSLRMSGGVFELRGAQEGNIAQTYGGPFFLEEGASEIRVISVKGYDPNNLNAGAQNRAATLNLMGGEEIVSVTRSAGGTVRFMEMPEAGAGAANITLAIPVLERQKILPWATYGDISSSFINDFATVLITTAAVVNADSSAGGFQQDVGSIPDEWREGTSAANIDASEGADFSYNMPLLDTTNPLRNDFALNTLRYVTKTDASMLIDTGKTLRLIGGAILVGGDVQGGQKEIVGGGRLMGGAVSTEGREILLHNYNAGAPFHLGVSIVDEVFVSNAQPFNKTGSVEAGSRSLYMALSKANYQRLAEGMLVTGPGLPPGTVIATLPSADFGLIILSQAATSTHSGVAYTFTASTGFVQTGVGTTILSGTNTYSGNTFVHGGVLRLNSANAVPGGIGVTGGTSHIVIEGGVLGLATSNFTRGLGTAKDQVEFKGSGGFAAYDQDRTVTFGGTLSKLRYGNDGFVPDGSSFVLGSHDATHKVTLMNPLDLGTISQAIRTPNGPAEIEGELGGNLVGLGRLVKFGLGTLRLGVSNVNSGGVELAEGRLVAANVPNVFGTGTGPVQVGTNRTNTTTAAGLELRMEGGTITKRLEIGNVNSSGGTWLTTRQADSAADVSDVGSQSSTMIVNGYPAMAYFDATNQDLKYVRANDPRGLTWGTPVTLASRGDIGLFPSLEIINGNPAVTYYDATNRCLMFIRATDTSGVFWAAPVIADANPVTTVAVQPDGKTLVGGTFTRMDGTPRVRMARFNANGSLDTSFDSNPGALEPINGDIFAIHVQADGKILIGGSFNRVAAQDRTGLVRLTATGALDTGYTPNVNGAVRVIVPQPDGKILIGGAFTSVGGTSRPRIARLLDTGANDTTFNPTAAAPNNEVRAIALEADGSVVLGGSFTAMGGTTRNRIARVSSTGVLDATFNPNANNEVRAIVVLPNGKLLVGGLFGSLSQDGITITRSRLALLNPTGTGDVSFDLEVNNEVRVLHLQPDGRVVMAGIFSTVGIGTPRAFLARLDVDVNGDLNGLLDTTFDPDPNFEVRSIAQHVDGDLALGGVFSNVGGATQQWVARLNPDGTADAGFNRRVDDLGRNGTLLSVNGNPAIAYRDEIAQSLKYLRAADVNGATWTNQPVTLDATGNAGHGIAMIIANIGGNIITKNTTNNTANLGAVANIGMPAVAYSMGDANAGGALKYIVANDANGTDWSTPLELIDRIEVIESVPTPKPAMARGRLSMLLVNASEVGGARPAIVYYNPEVSELRYIRATNSGGLTHNLNSTTPSLPVGQLAYTPAWNFAVDLGISGSDPSLAMINGQPTTALGTPAISFYDAGDLKLIRALNASGEPSESLLDPWASPVTVVSAGDVGRSSGLVMNDGVPGVSYYDATAGDLKFIVLSDAAGYSRLATTANTTWQGVVALDGSLMVSPGAGQTLAMTGAVTGLGGLKVAGDGVLSLSSAGNSYGAGMSGPGTAVSGGTIIRSGTVLLGHSNALGQTTVEMGDATPLIFKDNPLVVGDEIHETTFGSLTLTGGFFDPRHNGVFQSDLASGAFREIKATINGRTYTRADAGALILVKDESDHPERNGLYKVAFYTTLAEQPAGTMNLARADGMDTVAEMAAGTRVQVTSTNKSYFLASTVTDLNVSPVLWVPDQADPNVTLLANASGLTISNAIDVNAGTGSGTFTLGAASTVTGTVTFSGNIKLQSQSAGGEAQTLTLTSSTNTGRGVTLSGVISEASAGDTLSVVKIGAGVLTLTNANTYKGATTVKQGTLLVMNTTGSATGSGLVTVNAGAVLGGTGIIGGQVSLVGAPSSKAILRPGDPAIAGGVETLTINQPLQLRRDSVVEYTLGSTASYTQIAAQSLWLDHVTARLQVLLDPGYVATPGDEFTILDLTDQMKILNVLVGATNTAIYDYLNLPTSIVWDTSKFISEGKIIVESLRTTELIQTHPTSQSVAQGASVTFTVQPVVGITPSYQWRKNGTDLAGATSASLVIDNITEANEGNYSVKVTTLDGSQVSLAAALAVENKATIVQHPQHTTVDPGGTATFTVVATADQDAPIIGYQWYWNDEPLDGEIESTLVLTNVQLDNEGDYKVEVINAGGSVMSNSAGLNVNLSITILKPISNSLITVNKGAIRTFTIEATGTNIAYQWQQAAPGSSVYVDIPGANSASYTTGPLATTDTGRRFRGKLTNHLVPNGRFTRDFQVNVVVPEVVGQPQSMAVVVGDTVTMTVSATGANPRTYQWKRGAALLVDGVQANGAIISGAKTQTLTISNIPLAMADGYHCEVISDGFKMPPSAKGYVIVVGDTPLRVPLAIGTKADLKATVQIPASLPKTLEFPVTYYWLKDDVEIPLPDPNGRITTSVDKKTLTIKPLEGSNPGPGDSGIYKVKVVLHGREAIGRVAKLEVFHDKPDITNALSFPTGIVGGLYGEDGQGYQIPVDLDPAKAPVSFAWAGGTKLASEKTILTTPPAGLKLDTKTGRITGRPTKAGTYRLKVSATNTAGKDEVLNVEMVIEPLPTNLAGDYAGPLPRHLILNKNMGGRFDLKVTATGTFTGKLTLGPTTHSFSGLLEIVPSDVTQVLPHATVTIKRTGNPLPTPLILTLSINPAAQRLEVDAGNPVSTISDGTNTIAFHAWRNKWAGVGAPLATAYMANYTLALTIPDADRAADSTTVPQGFGYAAFTVAKNGTLTLTGKTADGETLTGAQFVGPEGEILVYVPLYTTNPKGSLLGTLFVDDEYSIVSTEDGDPANNVFNGVETLDWLRPKNLAKTARTYAAGIRSDGVTPLALTAVGGIAPPALPTSPLLGVTGTVNNAKIDFAAGGLVPAGGSPGSVIDPSIVFSINVKKITLPKYDIKAAVNPNPAKTTLTVDTKGIFKGTFALEDPDPRTPLPGKTLPAVKRTGNYAGVIIRNRTDGVDNIPGNGDDAVEYRGFGYFLLPQLLPPDTPPATLLTTSPILSGEVDLHTVPELD